MPEPQRQSPPESQPESRGASHHESPHTGHGFGRLLVAVYGLLALAATGRSILQISEYFARAPVPYLLSAARGASSTSSRRSGSPVATGRPCASRPSP